VAGVLEQHFADLVERQPELLAHHLTGAAETERAAAQWLKAFAATRFAHRETIGHFDRALGLTDTMSEGPARARHEIDARVDGLPQRSLIAIMGKGRSGFTAHHLTLMSFRLISPRNPASTSGVADVYEGDANLVTVAGNLECFLGSLPLTLVAAVRVTVTANRLSVSLTFDRAIA
jgi:hypothetical protein